MRQTPFGNGAVLGPGVPRTPGKAGIVVASLDQLPKVIEHLIAADIRSAPRLST
jgi:hypothetical protein